MAPIHGQSGDRPSGLSYLINAGHLAKDPERDSYQWTVYGGRADEANEETVHTSQCAVWSRDGAVRKVVTIKDSLQKIQGAFLATFGHFRQSNDRSKHDVKVQTDTPEDSDSGLRLRPSSRALCVILERQIQVHFAVGPSYTLSVPFRIKLAIAAPDGLIIERHCEGVLADRGAKDVDDGPCIYSLTDLIAGLCPIYTIAPVTSSRPSVPYGLQGPVDFGELHHGYAIVSASSITGANGQISTLLTTLHRESQQLAIWQLWRSKKHRLAFVMNPDSSSHKISQATRRSSIFNTPLGGSTNTPNFRRDQEALKGYAATTQGLGDTVGGTAVAAAARKSRKSRAKSTDQPRPDDMASQLEYQLAGSTQRQTRASRRVSSMMSRADLGAGDSFAATSGAYRGSRRGPSFGATNERKSLGASTFRKSRGSTINSLRASSMESGYLNMDLDSEHHAAPTQHEFDQLIRLNHPASSVEYAINLEMDGPNHEFVTRKIWSQRMDTALPDNVAANDHVKVEILQLTERKGSSNVDLAHVFVLDRLSGRLNFCHVRLTTIATDPSSVQQSSPHNEHALSLFSITVYQSSEACRQILAIRDKDVTGIVCLFPTNQVCVYTSLCTLRQISLAQEIRRTVHEAVNMRCAAAQGTISIEGRDGSTALAKIRLRASDPQIDHLLRILRSTIGGEEGRAVLVLHASLVERLEREYTVESSRIEWQALVMTMFTFAMGSVKQTVSTRPYASQPINSMQLTRVADRSKHSSRPLPAHWQWLCSATSGSDADLSGQVRTSLLEFEAVARHHLHDMRDGGMQWLKDQRCVELRTLCLLKILFAAHLWREDRKLSALTKSDVISGSAYLLPALAQIGRWLQLPAWDCRTGTYYHSEQDCILSWTFSDTIIELGSLARKFAESEPPSIQAWLEQSLGGRHRNDFPSMDQIAQLGGSVGFDSNVSDLLRRTQALKKFMERHAYSASRPAAMIEALKSCGLVGAVLDTLPEPIAAIGKSAALSCRADPDPSWSTDLLRLVGREDIIQSTESRTIEGQSIVSETSTAVRTLVTAAASSEHGAHPNKTDELDRHTITHLIFPEDRRFMDAKDMTNPMADQVAECPPEPFWSEAQHLEQQKRISQLVMIRTLSLPPGDAMINFASQQVILSERLQFPEFSVKCKMKPMNIISVADQSDYSEEKVGWASFHRGVARGLYISRKATGIETSWIIFNKPKDLTNRHAGLLLALGLTGRLRTTAKWLSYDYLQSRHAMTSVGLLLGLAASHIGTMDTLTTRPLSIHITRMLPPGTTPLNTPLITQTAGLFGLGLVYCNTRHRRMSEVMLTELEHREIEETDNNLDTIADESYRLAAGFALGFINLGHGGDLAGLYGMGLLERLLSMAAGSRPIEDVHIMDKCIPASVVAIALIYMKTEDRAVAHKVNVPETPAQLDHVRPDVLLLRSLAKHLIMWSEINALIGWVRRQLPKDIGKRLFGAHGKTNGHVPVKARLSSDNVPYFNIMTGCAWALSLKYAGTGNEVARDEVLACLDILHDVVRQEAFYYDAILARNTVRRCIDLLALAAATIMAGTGDLKTFRYLRRLHGRIDAETTYGSHIAAHLAIGALFLAGGTCTFGTSNMAVASLICAFYPLFPADVSDNRAHLQALRHMWVLATEPRCVVIKDLDSNRPVRIELEILMRNGEIKSMRSPCLLPDLHTISSLRTIEPAYWQVRLAFAHNPDHLSRFKENQILYVRQKSSQEISPVLFDSCLANLNEARNTPAWHRTWQWFFDLPAVRRFDQFDLGLVLGPASQQAIKVVGSATPLDGRLALMKDAKLKSHQAMWNLRLLFAWVDKACEDGVEQEHWLGKKALQALRMELTKRLSETADPWSSELPAIAPAAASTDMAMDVEPDYPS